MSKRKWNSGKPPFRGWWNASYFKDFNVWRWWNGQSWSGAAFPGFPVDLVEKRSKIADPFQGRIKWTTHWPEGARVPRINPNKKG